MFGCPDCGAKYEGLDCDGDFIKRRRRRVSSLNRK